MPELTEQADIESVVIGYLDSLGLGAGVSGELPPGFTRGDAHLRVIRIGGIARDQGFLDRARLQVDAYEISAVAAYDLAARALKALKLLPTSDFDTGGPVVTAVEQDLGLRNAADLEQDGAPRYLFGVVVFAHPARALEPIPPGPGS